MRDWSEYIFYQPHDFEEQAVHVFEHQFYHNKAYQEFCMALDVNISGVEGLYDIPLLPIEIFREIEVVGSYVDEIELIFKSSGTTGMKRSVHKVASAQMYRQSILEGLKKYYKLDELVFWGYVPGYAENPESSLIWMIKQLIDQDQSGQSRFLPLDEPINADEIAGITENGKHVMVFGAAFGFLDLIARQRYELPPSTIIMETGGMKTHRRQITRAKLHEQLADGFGLDIGQIHSEYGMTEMLSQAYAQGGSWFKTTDWLDISIRNPENPMELMPDGEEGLIGVIDLANVHSCSFILTQDTGIRRPSGEFTINGRWKHANLRGCNFLVEEE